MNKMNRQFEPSYIGNGWGNYVDIENFKYDLDSMLHLPLIKNNVDNYNIDIDKKFINDNKNITKAVTNLIIRVSSTTIVTVAFACFIYCSL